MTFVITFTPVYVPGSTLSLNVTGAHSIRINGAELDFSILGDGDCIPEDVADQLHPVIARAPITRIGSQIHMKLMQYYGGETTEYIGDPVVIMGEGPVTLPFATLPDETEESVVEIDPNVIVTAAMKNAEEAAAARRLEFPNLYPDQFWFALRATGYADDVQGWLDDLKDPESPNYDLVLWAAISSKLEFATYFERDHPFVEGARIALGIPEAEIDALWKFAAGL